MGIRLVVWRKHVNSLSLSEVCLQAALATSAGAAVTAFTVTQDLAFDNNHRYGNGGLTLSRAQLLSSATSQMSCMHHVLSKCLPGCPGAAVWLLDNTAAGS